MTRQFKARWVAWLTSILLAIFAVEVLVNRFCIRAHQATIAEDVAKDKLQILWEYTVTQLRDIGIDAIPSLPEIYGAPIMAYVMTSDGELISSTRYYDGRKGQFREFVGNSFVVGDALMKARTPEPAHIISQTTTGEEVIACYGTLDFANSQLVLILQVNRESVRARNIPTWYFTSEVIAIFCLSYSMLALLSFIYVQAQKKIIEDQQILKLNTLQRTNNRVALLKQAIDRSNVAVVLFDDNGVVQEVTKPAAALFHRTEVELVQHNVCELLQDRYRRLAQKLIGTLRSADWKERQLTLRLKIPGQVEESRLVWNIHRMIYDGKVYGVASLVYPFQSSKH